MHELLTNDLAHLPAILARTQAAAEQFLNGLDERPMAVSNLPDLASEVLPEVGFGAEKTLEYFQRVHGPRMSGSAGPRYFGFVTGGTTPAALVGDWLVSAFDQNVSNAVGSGAHAVELQALVWLRQLFGIPEAYTGAFVTGATVSNFVGLAMARQWVAQQRGIDVAQQGLYALPPIRVLSTAPHSSVYKALAMLGMGRDCLEIIPSLPGREAVDPEALEARLAALGGEPCVLVASAGTVNTVDFDDLVRLSELKRQHHAWLHVDAAFGGFAACVPEYQHLLEGLSEADSITIDAHKWLNVPYDAAMQFSRHQSLQLEVFRNSAAYLGAITDNPDFVHLTPENSRRFRALPTWFSLLAYGRDGYREIVARNCWLARALGARIEDSPFFRLLAAVRLNVVCFTLQNTEPGALEQRVAALVKALHQDGRVFVTPTVYGGIPGIRAAFANWRTTEVDLAITWTALEEMARTVVVSSGTK